MWPQLISAGASILGGVLGSKKAKTPEYQAPAQYGLGDLPHYQNLKQLAEKRISGQDVGFGDDFVNRQSSPGIAQIDANFTNRTLPTLSNEASKRGLARSSIVQDQIGQADLQRNRDIQSMVAQFQLLNEQQKKRDITEGISVAENQRNAAQRIMEDRTRSTQNQNDFNMTNYPNQLKSQGASNLLGLETGSQFGNLISTALGQNKNTPGVTAGEFSTETQLLGKYSDDELERLYQELSKGR